MNGRASLLLGAVLTLAGVITIGAGALVAPAAGNSQGTGWTGMMGANGMMGSAWSGAASAPGPDASGFVAGTTAAPRLVRILATPVLRFSPDVVTVKAGETITFEVTTMGPAVHEFMVGPAADMAANKDGTPEITDIGMMQTKSLTYTFTGSGPFAFSCHAPGHYEAGMKGTIVVQ